MNNKKIVIASQNQGKISEFTELLNPLQVEVLSLKDFPEISDIPETGSTFEENALLKAREVAKKTGLLSLADDSGLEVDYLGGKPGIYSARFAGEPKSDARNNAKLLKLLTGVPWEKRTAQFKCVIAIALPAGKELCFTGSCQGIILENPQGEGGFGYDPLFYVEKEGQTFAQLNSDIKNEISHRGQGVKKAMNFLKGYFAEEV